VTRVPAARLSQSALPARAATVLADVLEKPLQAGLHIVATPIGNLADITLRALAVLARADSLYCEDTRHSRILLAHYGISRPSKSYHEHNADQVRPAILGELAAGKSVALISNAGTPLVSDPGCKLVRDALAAGHSVTSLPGASAALTALSIAGLPSDTFLFVGFLPARQVSRHSRLIELAAIPATLILFEAPSRLAQTLSDLAAVLGARETAVARELTKLHEELRRGTPEELAAWARQTEPRGEIVILVGPPAPSAVADDVILSQLTPLLATTSLRDAAKTLANALGVSRNRVYHLGLGLKRGEGT
jgi:16S rRNA (cytidine1402-2'-O)-methyltransferase